MKQIILALETATNACSAALITPDNHFGRFEITQNKHTQLLLPMVESLLLEAKISLQDIQAIAVGRGPGSFTGVRIAVSAAQGLGFGLDIPVYPVSTLEALSREIVENAIILPSIDARMNEVYAAAFSLNNDDLTCLHEERLCSPQAMLDLFEKGDKVIALGSGWDAYFAEISRSHSTNNIHFVPEKYPDAKHIGLIALAQIKQGTPGVLAQNVLPVYLRDNVALKQTPKINSE